MLKANTATVQATRRSARKHKHSRQMHSGPEQGRRKANSPILRTRVCPTHLKDSINALALGIPDGAQPVARHRARQQARDVGHDEPQPGTARAAQQAPEFVVGRPVALGQALLPEHLLEHVAELLLAGLLRRLRARAGAGAGPGPGGTSLPFLLLSLVLEEVPRPAKCGLAGAGLRSRGVVAGLELSEGVAARGGGGGAAVELPLAIVLPPPGVVGQREVGVVYELELLRARGALGGVGGDTVGVGLERGTEKRLSALVFK